MENNLSNIVETTSKTGVMSSVKSSVTRRPVVTAVVALTTVAVVAGTVYGVRKVLANKKVKVAPKAEAKTKATA